MKKYFPLLLLLGPTIFFFFRLFYPQSSLFMIPDFGESDVLHLNLPFKEILSSSLKTHQWPLWTPNLANGFPVLAEGQIGTFYLPNLVLFRFLPTIEAYNLNLALAFLLASFGTYLFLRELKLSSVSSTFGAFVFTFCGYLSVHLNHFNLVQAASLLPFLYWSAILLWKKPSIKFVILFAFTLSQHIFTGHFYIVFISLIGIAVSWIMFLLDAIKNKKTFPFFHKTSYLFLGSLLSLSLSSIQLLPTIELMKLSQRSAGMDFETTTSFPYSFKHFATFINPYFFGNPADASYPVFNNIWGIFWENTAYLGILPLIFALLALRYFREKIVKASFILLVISLLLVLGKNSPLYFIFSFPPFNFFRVPSKFLLLTTFSLVILSAYTFEQMIKKLTKSEQSRIQAMTYICYQRKFLIFSLISIIFFLIIIDEYRFSYNYPPVSPSAWWTKIPETAQFLEKKEGRITTIGASLFWNEVFFKKGWQDINPYVYFRNSLYPNYNVFFNIPQFDINTGGLVPRRTTYLMNMSQNMEFNKEKKTATISGLSENVLSSSGVKYLISAYKLTNNPNFLPLETINPPENLKLGPFYLYENKTTLPRAYLAYKTQKIATLEELYKELEKGDFLAEKTAFTEDYAFFVNSPKEDRDFVKILSQKETAIVLEAESDNETLLVLTDTNYPGWQATIDHQPTKIITVNLTQRGIILPAGKHLIRFTFNSDSFRTGKNITLLTWIIISAVVFLSPLLFPHKAAGNKKLSLHL